MNSQLTVLRRAFKNKFARRILLVLAAAYVSSYIVARLAGKFLFYNGTLLLGEWENHGGVFHVSTWRATIWQPLAFVEARACRLVKRSSPIDDSLGNRPIRGEMNSEQFARFSRYVPANFSPIAGKYFNREWHDKESYSVVYAVPPETSISDLRKLANSMMLSDPGESDPGESGKPSQLTSKSIAVGPFVFPPQLPRVYQTDDRKSIFSVEFVLDKDHQRVLMVWDVEN